MKTIPKKKKKKKKKKGINYADQLISRRRIFEVVTVLCCLITRCSRRGCFSTVGSPSGVLSMPFSAEKTIFGYAPLLFNLT